MKGTVSQTRPSGSNALAIGLAMGVCFSCLFVTCATPTALAYLAGPGTHPADAAVDLIPMCAWARNGRAGLWWNANVKPTRAFANSSRYNAVCLALPWPAAMPDQGRPVISLTP